MLRNTAVAAYLTSFAMSTMAIALHLKGAPVEEAIYFMLFAILLVIVSTFLVLFEATDPRAS